MFEFIDETLYQVAVTIEMQVVLTLLFAIFAWRNYSFRALRFYLLNQRVAIISLVSDDGFAGDALNEWGGLTNIACLACGQAETKTIPKTVYAQVNLGGEATFTAPQSLFSMFF